MSNKLLKIWCYDTESDQLYELYEEQVPSDYVAPDRIVDAKAYAENGLDILYFTDNASEVRQLRCEVPTGFVANSLTKSDLSVQRRGANGTITIDGIKPGGSLLSGSYQFAYRMADPLTKRFTKWSSLTLPVQTTVTGDIISLGIDGTTAIQSAGIGLFTDKQINITIAPSNEELENFDYFQIAVVENILPTVQLSASILPIEPVSRLVGYEYKANQRIDRVPIEDIVVDYAAVKTAKTLNIKQNRLFLGNINYADLDPGNPTVTGSVIKKAVNHITEPTGFTATRSGDQSVGPAPINGTRVNWNQGAIDTLNYRYTHSGADQDYYFLMAIDFAYLTGTGSTVRFELTKNATTVLTSIVVNTAGVHTAGILTTLSNGDYVDVRIYTTTATIRINALGSKFTGSTAEDVVDIPSDSGYFRNEVYRYGIVYKDEFGNRSVPKPLDMAGITGNRIESGLIDMKFPARNEEGGDYSILDGNNLPQLLGLQLTIDDHPSWARSFEIVRVKRIKRVLFQSPLIPMMYVQGVGAILDYPGLVRAGTATTTAYDSNQPMTSSKVYIPKNLLWPELRDIIRNENTTGTNANRRINGEARLERRADYDMGIIFPPESMYTSSLYNFTGSEILETVDYTLNMMNLMNFPDTKPDRAPVAGNGIVTVQSVTLHSLANGDYFFHSGFTGKQIPTTERTRKINEYKFIDNLSAGTVVGGELVQNYDQLSTTGVTWGFKPNAQRMAIIKMGDAFPDEGSVRREFASGVHNAVSGGNPIIGSSGINFETNLTNRYVNMYSGVVDNQYIQSLRVVNIVNDSIGDSRYGDVDDEHEFISTGAVYSFSPTELVAVGRNDSLPITLDVFGGDCKITPHIFKVSDSSYSVVNQAKHNGTAETLSDLLRDWDGKVFGGATNEPVICIPVAVKASGQFVQMFLESEFAGNVMDFDVLELNGTQANHPVLNVKTEANIRTPLTYRYNQNISKQNDQKIYLSKPEISFEQNAFPARVLYSDVKVYNSDVSGFDLFRVLNFYDLEEDKGNLTKLAVAGDSLYAIQEYGVKYLPTGQTQLEQTDAGTIAVGTSDVIGRAITVDNNRGGQHLGGIVETGGSIYVPDNFNKSIYQLTREGLKPIPISNETYFRNLFSSMFVERNVTAFYDPVRFQYWLMTGSTCNVFHEAGIWSAEMEFGGKLKHGVYTNQNLYMVGDSGNSIDVYSFYTGTVNSFMGTTVVPSVKFVINPDPDFGKMFDNMMLVASERLDEVDMIVEREESLGDQEVLGMNLDREGVDGNYRIKTLRDNRMSRLRGLRAIATVKWGNVLSTLSSVVTKYRLTRRHPY